MRKTVKFDPNNLSLKFIVLISAVLLCPLALAIWAGNAKYQYDGTDFIAVNPQGQLTVKVGTSLFRADKKGQSLPTIDVQAMGVIDYLGNLTFFPNGDLLLRKGNSPSGLLQGLATFNREKNLSSTEAKDNEGLFRCQIESGQCQRFGDGSIDFNQGFFSVYDATSDTVFISEASRHTVYQFDATGRLLNKQDSGFEFPNGMRIADNTLYLVDTNNKAIKAFPIKVQGSTPLTGAQQYSTENSAAKAMNAHWPYTIHQAGRYWWVVINNNSMAKGGIFLFDQSWQYVKQLPLREGSDPISLTTFNNLVLVSDIEADAIETFDLNGDPKGPFQHTELAARLENHAIKRNRLEWAEIAGYIALALLIVGGSIAALILQVRSQENVPAISEESATSPVQQAVHIPIKEVRWFKPTRAVKSLKTIRQYQLIGFIAMIAMFATSLYYAYTLTNQAAYFGLVSIPPFMALLLVITGLFLLFLAESGRFQLGMYQENLVIRDRVDKTIYAKKSDEVIYDGITISVGALSVPARQLGVSALQHPYTFQAFIKHLYPFLTKAQMVTPLQMNKYLRKRKDKRIRRQMVQIFMMMALFLLYILYTMKMVIGVL